MSCVVHLSPMHLSCNLNQLLTRFFSSGKWYGPVLIVFFHGLIRLYPLLKKWLRALCLLCIHTLNGLLTPPQYTLLRGIFFLYYTATATATTRWKFGDRNIDELFETSIVHQISDNPLLMMKNGYFITHTDMVITISIIQIDISICIQFIFL